MNALRVCRLIPAPLLVWAALATPISLHAQSAEAQESAKVLVIEREFTKPGRDGASHEATEAAYIRAAEAGGAKFHYVALNSITGPNRAIFISEYPSFEAMETEHKSVGSALAAALDRANVADGNNLDETDSSAWIRRDDLSTNVNAPPTGTRYIEISKYIVKPGHMHEWDELVKMYVDAAKDIPEMHWTTYELAYGNADGPTFIALTAYKSASEADGEFAADERFGKAMSPDARKKMGELESACISKEMTNLFSVNPKMSMPTDDMVKAEPSFWRPKSTARSHKPASAKPEPASGQ